MAAAVVCQGGCVSTLESILAEARFFQLHRGRQQCAEGGDGPQHPVCDAGLLPPQVLAGAALQ